MNCFACGKELEPDLAGIETNYQFDNALWLAFHGGYGMFVDNIEATMPYNTADRWLQHEDGAYILDKNDEMIVNENWKPAFYEPRVLGGDYEAVICHECAHELCAKVPWLYQLINPPHSHSHKSKYYEELIAEGHVSANFGNCCMYHMWEQIDSLQKKSNPPTTSP